jgi:hypothetical protein
MDERELASRMSTAGTAWRTAQGTWRHWRRQDLVTLAFNQHFDRLGEEGEAWTVLVATKADDADEVEHREPTDPVIESVWSVAIDRPARRMRVGLEDARGEESRPDVVVWVGDTFWARTGQAVLTNDGNVHQGHGGDEIGALLEPDYVAALYELRAIDELVLLDRACTRVAARERPGVGEQERYQYRGDPFGMIAGGEDFLLDVDDATGVLVRVVKLVDGEQAEIMEWTHLTLDNPLDEALFAPLE